SRVRAFLVGLRRRRRLAHRRLHPDGDRHNGSTRGQQHRRMVGHAGGSRRDALPLAAARDLGAFVRRKGGPAVTRLFIASPRGYCAGVERAVDTVEQVLSLYGPPVYVRKQIVHNRHVVRSLEGRGVVFVDSLADVPDRATVVFSAHGVAPAVREAARDRGLSSIDATCPLVHKVHAEVRRYAAAGHAIVLIGHAGREEVEGTSGEAPDSVVLVQSVADAEHITLPVGRSVAYVTQTTLSVDDTRDIVAVLRRRFPNIVEPAREDICYATTNRQQAVKELLPLIDL